MLSEPAIALTDLVLGGAALAIAAFTDRFDLVDRTWVRVFISAGAAALAGFVHHGFVTFHRRVAATSFAAVTLVVIVSMWELLTASVAAVFGPRYAALLRWLLAASVVAYLALAVATEPDLTALTVASSPIMAGVVGAWLVGLRRQLPMAPRMLAAFSVMAAGAGVHSLRAHHRFLGLDPVSWYHLVQIPGLAAVAWAASSASRPPWLRLRHRPAG